MVPEGDTIMRLVFDGEQEEKLHRDVFAEKFRGFINEGRDVVYLNCDVMEPCGMTKLWKEFPKNVFNCGISEANMIGIAAGMNLAGSNVFAQTFGCFATRRCLDQLFISVAYSGLGLKLIGSDPGVCAGFNGGTHMPFEDLALMRAIPGAIVLEMSDGVMFDKLLDVVVDEPGLVYMRTTRKTYKKIYSEGWKFEVGGSALLCEGTDVVVFASGLLTAEALSAAQILEQQGISTSVVDMYSIKPLDSQRVRETASAAKLVITCDNHNTIGGLGDAVSSVLLEHRVYRPFVKLGVSDEFGEVGPVSYLMERFGLTSKDIAKVAVDALGA